MARRDLEGWTIAFDLDGTLVDSAPDIIAALNRLLVIEGLPALPVAAARRLVGQGVLPLLRRGFAEAGGRWDETREAALFDAFIADYGVRIAEHGRAFDGVVEALNRLAGRGARLCVVTNKRTDLSLKLIAALDLDRHFAAVCGPDQVSARKPDGAHLREGVVLAGGDPARVVMVGDSAADVGAAKAIGAPCVVVSFGYTDTPAADLGGDLLIDHFDQLEAAIDGLCMAPAI